MMNDSPPPRQPVPLPGLCGSCREARVVHSDRGAAFLRCGRADHDPEFPRYPVLPVLACRGYGRLAPE